MTPDPVHGVIVIDKPPGLTSHDVVARARRLLGETRIGHTGTLDPLATGVLPLAIGRATRLVRFLTASDKEYDASIRFGLSTDTYDVTGRETRRTNAVPSREMLLSALATLTGTYPQVPPAFSAKKVGGRRSYELAREQRPANLAPVMVSVSSIDLLELNGDRARVAMGCSAGFYVRAFAHAVGELTGTGACLEALTRTRSGEFRLDTAISIDELQNRDDALARLVPMAALLRQFPAVTIGDRGRAHVAHGRELNAIDYECAPASSGQPAGRIEQGPDSGWVRVLDASGGLVAVATTGRRPGSLHPSVVLM